MSSKGSDGAPNCHVFTKRTWLIFESTKFYENSERRWARPIIMAEEWHIKKRRPVRKKAIVPLLKELESSLGIDLAVDGAFIEMAMYGPWEMVFLDKTPIAVQIQNFEHKKYAFLTLRGFLANLDAQKWVEVDHGAIPFLMNGADCMVAGVHSADSEINEGDLVWIRDMEHKRPLAIGWAVTSGLEMPEATKGKGIKTIHWVGDELWNME